MFAPAAPGAGDSPPLPEADEYRLSRLAELVASLLDALGLERTSYVGFSWGASIGVHLAARHPERLAALVLLDAGYTDAQDRPGFERQALDALADSIANEHAGYSFPSWDAFVARARERRRSWRPALEERLRAGMQELDGRIVARSDPRAAAAAWYGLQEEPPSTVLPQVAPSGIPVLLVTASETRAAPHGAAALERFRGAIPHADVRSVESGHDLLADAPEETIRIVGEWLAVARG